MILKFQPNMPALLFLTATEGIAKPSQFPDAGIEFQWKGRDRNGQQLIFYAPAALNQLLTPLAKTPDIYNRELKITKSVNGKQINWDVRFADDSAAVPATSAGASQPATSNEDKSSGVQKLTRLFMQCYLEVLNANVSLNGHGLKGEEVRNAATTIFIAATNKGFPANVDRIKLLLEATKRDDTKPLPANTTEPAAPLVEPEYEYEPGEQPRQPTKPPATNGRPKLSAAKVQALIAGATKKHISVETLVAELRMRLNDKNIRTVEDVRDDDFTKACTALSKIPENFSTPN